MCECEALFTKFLWTNLTSIDPNDLPKSSGVYAIRTRKRGSKVKEVIEKVYDYLKRTEWHPFMDFVNNRLERVTTISDCPIIYIGAAPTGLMARYNDLCGQRHTVFFPILALLLSEWQLDYGYVEAIEAKREEAQLKTQYRRVHGALPALVKR